MTADMKFTREQLREAMASSNINGAVIVSTLNKLDPVEASAIVAARTEEREAFRKMLQTKIDEEDADERRYGERRIWDVALASRTRACLLRRLLEEMPR